MVVRDFNVVGVALLPGKTNPPLIVDPNTVLPLAVPAIQALGFRSFTDEDIYSLTANLMICLRLREAREAGKD